MVQEVRLTFPVARVLRVLLEDPRGEHYGLTVMRDAQLSSGSLYPILRRLEQAQWLTSSWEKVDVAEAGRPRRRYYRLTGEGVVAARSALAEAYALTSSSTSGPTRRPGLIRRTL